jgi:hypothetical protein
MPRVGEEPFKRQVPRDLRRSQTCVTTSSGTRNRLRHPCGAQGPGPGDQRGAHKAVIRAYLGQTLAAWSWRRSVRRNTPSSRSPIRARAHPSRLSNTRHTPAEGRRTAKHDVSLLPRPPSAEGFCSAGSPAASCPWRSGNPRRPMRAGRSAASTRRDGPEDKTAWPWLPRPVSVAVQGVRRLPFPSDLIR